MSAASLGVSVSEASSSPGVLLGHRGECRHTAGRGRWACEVYDAQGEGPDPWRTSDCVNRWQWSFTALAVSLGL